MKADKNEQKRPKIDSYKYPVQSLLAKVFTILVMMNVVFPSSFGGGGGFGCFF